MLVNPSTLYSGGNVRFDSSPYLRIALQQRARKQALNDALYKHYSELPDKLNSAGVRIQDFEGENGGINNDIAIAKQYFMGNAFDILRGGIAQQRYAQMIQAISQRIGQSKSTAQFQLKSGQDFFNGKHDYREDDLKVKDAVERSIYDPKHYKDPETKMPYTFNDYSVAAAPYTPQYQLKHDKVITANVQPDKLEGDIGVFDPVTKKVTYNYGYTPEKINEIVQTGLSTLKSDKTMYYAMQDALKDHDQVKVASEALQKDYDRTHKDGMKVVVDTPEEMYAGLQIDKFSNAKIPKTLSDKKSIDEYNAAEWNRRNAITNAQRVKAASVHSARADARLNKMMAGTEAAGYPLDDVVKDLAIEHEIEGADGESMGKQQRVYKKDIPVGEFQIYSPKEAMVHGYKDIKTGEEYFLPTTDANGHKQLVGEGGKIIGAEVARQNTINKVVPANKVKQGMYFNKEGKKTTQPKKKDPLGLF